MFERERTMTINDRTSVPPELNGVLLVHAALRRGATDLLAATERFGDTTNDPAGLVRLWTFFEGGLRRHHLGEDEIVYPLVASRQPDFADVESEMRAEHDSIDEHLARADAAFARLRSDAGPRPRRPRCRRRPPRNAREPSEPRRDRGVAGGGVGDHRRRAGQER